MILGQCQIVKALRDAPRIAKSLLYWLAGE